MSDELERRLRAAGEDLPGPDPAATAAARAAFLSAEVPPAHGRPAPRRLLLAAAAVVALAAAFGGGYAVASSSEETPARPAPRAALNAGPGFLPAEGWDVAATGATQPPRAQAAVAANVPLAQEDRALLGAPAATRRRLGANGILLYARFTPAGTGAAPPQRLLPLRFADAAGTGAARRLWARVGRYDVDVRVWFGAAAPAPDVLAEAAQALGRLAVPACPAPLSLANADLPAARRFVLRWLRTHYQGDAADLRGARATATLGAAMPRGGAARAACGEQVRQRTVEVDVVLPRLERISASLSQLSYFVSRTPDGWTVWQRIH